jgi:hypothetical protein
VSLNWKSLSAAHIKQACSMLLSKQSVPAVKKAGLYVRFQAVDLPAKEVLRIAYRLANDLSPEAKLRFSSGEGAISRLRALGFEAGRKPAANENEHG